jgi:nitroreductase
MLLMAAAWGLSSTWIARAARVPAVRDLLGIPEPLRGIAFVALGPTETEPRWEENMRQPLTAKVHRGRY